MTTILNFKDKSIITPIILVLLMVFLESLASGIGAIFAILAGVILVLKKQNILALLFTIFILTFSDSRLLFFSFAQTIKPIFIVLLGAGAFFIQEKNKLFKWFIPFFTIAFICVLRNDMLFLSFQKTLSLTLLVFAVPLIIEQLQNNLTHKYSIKIIFIIPLTILITGFIIHLVSPNLTSAVDRFRGLLGNPNGLGVFAAMYFLLFKVVEDVHGKIFTRNERIAILGLIILSLILSGSRTSMGMLILFYCFNYVFRFQLPIAIILCLVLFALGQVILANITLVIIGLGLEEYLRIETIKEISGRTVAWDYAWLRIQDNFILSKGFTYAEQVFSTQALEFRQSGHQGNVHNSYLTIWLNTGLLGVITYFTPIFLLFIKAFKRYRTAIPVLLCVTFSANMESWLSGSLNPVTVVFFMILSIYATNNDTIWKRSQMNNQAMDISSDQPAVVH